jgi:hypothetical protein
MASRLLDRLTKVRARRSGKVYKITFRRAPGDDSVDPGPARFVALGGSADWRRKAELAAALAETDRLQTQKCRADRSSPASVPVQQDDASSHPVLKPGEPGAGDGAE